MKNRNTIQKNCLVYLHKILYNDENNLFLPTWINLKELTVKGYVQCNIHTQC